MSDAPFTPLSHASDYHTWSGRGLKYSRGILIERLVSRLSAPVLPFTFCVELILQFTIIPPSTSLSRSSRNSSCPDSSIQIISTLSSRTFSNTSHWRRCHGRIDQRDAEAEWCQEPEPDDQREASKTGVREAKVPSGCNPASCARRNHGACCSMPGN